MPGESKCPKCGKPVTRMHVAAMTSSLEGNNKSFPSIVFTCPACHVILGSQIDPVAVMSGTVKGLATALRGGAPKGGGTKS